MDAKLCTVANKMPQLQGLELHAMCFVFKTAVVFLCKERLRQKKKSLIVSFTKKNWQNPNNETNFLLFKGELKQVFRSWGGDYSLSGIDSRVSRLSSRLCFSFLTRKKKYVSSRKKYFLWCRFWFPWRRCRCGHPIPRMWTVTICGSWYISNHKFNEEMKKSTICQIGEKRI